MRCALLKKVALLYIIGAQVSVHVDDFGQIESSREREIRMLLQAAKAMDVNVVTTCAGYVSSQVKKGGVSRWISELGHAVYSCSNA
jgi:hypothetical protein